MSISQMFLLLFLAPIMLTLWIASVMLLLWFVSLAHGEFPQLLRSFRAKPEAAK